MDNYKLEDAIDNNEYGGKDWKITLTPLDDSKDKPPENEPSFLQKTANALSHVPGVGVLGAAADSVSNAATTAAAGLKGLGSLALGTPVDKVGEQISNDRANWKVDHSVSNQNDPIMQSLGSYAGAASKVTAPVDKYLANKFPGVAQNIAGPVNDAASNIGAILPVAGAVSPAMSAIKDAVSFGKGASAIELPTKEALQEAAKQTFKNIDESGKVAISGAKVDNLKTLLASDMRTMRFNPKTMPGSAKVAKDLSSLSFDSGTLGSVANQDTQVNLISLLKTRDAASALQQGAKSSDYAMLSQMKTRIDNTLTTILDPEAVGVKGTDISKAFSAANDMYSRYAKVDRLDDIINKITVDSKRTPSADFETKLRAAMAKVVTSKRQFNLLSPEEKVMYTKIATGTPVVNALRNFGYHLKLSIHNPVSYLAAGAGAFDGTGAALIAPAALGMAGKGMTMASKAIQKSRLGQVRNMALAGGKNAAKVEPYTLTPYDPPQPNSPITSKPLGPTPPDLGNAGYPAGVGSGVTRPGPLPSAPSDPAQYRSGVGSPTTPGPLPAPVPDAAQYPSGKSKPTHPGKTDPLIKLLDETGYYSKKK